ncbi:hypothetical protein ABE42_13690 [Bacillus thuringiensis]|uniref:R2-like protein n=1 Tax=Bacillus thuringiensis YBT-1518 TaxID=529122 RepID=A0A9W3PDD3_BACTU|nr:hypothetical protein [Bacillus thuringiensis]EKS8367219.1 hypothetical protein [Bacillus cereus]AGC39286.1 R2-like protein [Bacillus thuringiensis YBT-1518]MBG9484776.1 hypothetical protein [Bacillus thuringiensis]MBG9580228.1 hypothetical protein [Bacillus thuringiensis]PGL21332.1 hypothetical protein CN916_27315 [Bacillus thuringiensis]
MKKIFLSSFNSNPYGLNASDYKNFDQLLNHTQVYILATEMINELTLAANILMFYGPGDNDHLEYEFNKIYNTYDLGSVFGPYYHIRANKVANPLLTDIKNVIQNMQYFLESTPGMLISPTLEKINKTISNLLDEIDLEFNKQNFIELCTEFNQGALQFYNTLLPIINTNSAYLTWMEQMKGTVKNIQVTLQAIYTQSPYLNYTLAWANHSLNDVFQSLNFNSFQKLQGSLHTILLELEKLTTVGSEYFNLDFNDGGIAVEASITLEDILIDWENIQNSIDTFLNLM